MDEVDQISYLALRGAPVVHGMYKERGFEITGLAECGTHLP